MEKFIELNNSGLTHYGRGDFQKAYKLFMNAFKLSGGDVSISYNLALTLYSMGKWEECVKMIDDNCQLGSETLFLKSLSLLNLTDKLGFHFYKNRIGRSGVDGVNFPQLPIPWIWNFSELSNSNVLILNEQGFGDEFLFSGIIPRLSSICNSVTYQVYPENIKLFQHIFRDLPNVEFFQERSFNMDFVMKFDSYSSSGEIFASYNLSGDTISYEISEYSGDVGNGGIGIFYKANTLSKNWKMRSIDPKIFKKFKKNNKFINLQKGEMLDFCENPELLDFFDTYNIIKDSEFVITIDSSVANLCGIMGKRCYLISKGYLDWRYKWGFYKSIEVIGLLDIPNILQ